MSGYEDRVNPEWGAMLIQLHKGLIQPYFVKQRLQYHTVNRQDPLAVPVLASLQYIHLEFSASSVLRTVTTVC